jgi:hypothetical protein
MSENRTELPPLRFSLTAYVNVMVMAGQVPALGHFCASKTCPTADAANKV